MVYPRPRDLRLALNAGVGRAVADLPADLVLVSSYTPGELEPLLLADTERITDPVLMRVAGVVTLTDRPGMILELIVPGGVRSCRPRRRRTRGTGTRWR